MAMCKFIQAQRSLMFFSFENPFDAFKEVFQESWLESIFNEGFIMHDMPHMVEEGILEGPPSDEIVEAVFEALSKISGKTVNKLRERFLSEFYLPVEHRYSHSDKVALPMDALRQFFKGLENDAHDRSEQHAKYGHSDDMERLKKCKQVLSGIRLYFKAQSSLKGLHGCKLVTRIYELSLKLGGMLNLFELLPSFDEFMNKQDMKYTDSDGEPYPRPGPEWMERYMKSLEPYIEEGNGQPDRPSVEYLNGLREDFSELVEVVKAFWPYREKFHPPMPEDMRNRAESEVATMFALVSEDSTTTQI
jgi:hypothetical protein